MFGLRRGTRDSLVTMIATPTVWALHFLFCYVATAVACAPNADIFKAIGGVRAAIGVATVLSLLFCWFAGFRAWREWRQAGGKPPHDQPTDEDRERQMELASALLSGLSFLAIIFTALPALLVVDCR
ncbi:hypothetical protein [Aureimonas sp. AU22]|jgi:hypothetical protein|uniref:hypothetical protein n=1 Tax=Aureimonas sp. AU22 TaxID=1638162 RepID=UPI000782981A|nr:hypothetical protein [Aureimonas sp. AU22]